MSVEGISTLCCMFIASHSSSYFVTNQNITVTLVHYYIV